MAKQELPIIQKTYDLILWYVPRLNKFPKNQKFVLGDRVQDPLYLPLRSSRFVRLAALASYGPRGGGLNSPPDKGGRGVL